MPQTREEWLQMSKSVPLAWRPDIEALASRPWSYVGLQDVVTSRDFEQSQRPLLEIPEAAAYGLPYRGIGMSGKMIENGL